MAMAMSEKKYDSITDELLDICGGGSSDAIVETVEEAIVEETAMPDPIPWQDLGDGKGVEWKRFEDVFGWKNKHSPPHLVPVYTGYDCALPKESYVPPKELYEWFSFAAVNKVKSLTVGPTGSGKTLMAEHYAASCGRPCLRIEHNVELDRATVFGQVHITDGDTDFVPGMLISSTDDPTLVILDEVSRAPGHANMIYKRIMDRGEIFVPEMKDAGLRAITPHEGWYVCGTDNTKGDGEDMDKYPMSNVQDAAFRNAWGILLEADYLSMGEEQALIHELSSMPRAEVVKLAKFSKLLHAGFKKGDINTAFSPRQLITICDFYEKGVDIKQAITLAYTNFCSKSEYSDVQETYRAVYGS